jgi:predicted anti-sigma-YlaC factor YlaD
MIHKTIQKKLILYLDGNLSGHEKVIVEEHLSKCRLCEKEIQSLSAIWKNENALERITPSDYLWTRLEVRLNKINQDTHHSLFDKLIPAARLSIIAALILIAIFVGNYIGKVSNSDLKTNTREYFWNIYNLDSFEPIPTESIGKAFTLASNNEENEAQQ